MQEYFATTPDPERRLPKAEGGIAFRNRRLHPWRSSAAKLNTRLESRHAPPRTSSESSRS
jgi:hypothetical protein